MWLMGLQPDCQLRKFKPWKRLKGPFNTSLSNEAPWILTVSASTLDRQTQAHLVLGNNYQFNGESLFQPSDFPSTQLPLVYAGMNSPDSAFCAPGSLDDTDVKGKVV
ncbi:hypothetical protein HYC85_026640 [Camellia sinensis]|uniref:Uncharacterized protein n=1 Tax=Camellia sinensis TaxID=4442 RepID=A0A7J7G6C3_CAMSI|nr:hypothetical protein HYC85_026640 [Camellia sinensis]